MNSDLTKAQAQALVEARIKAIRLPDGDVCTLLHDQTIERAFGWVFFYASKRHLETQDFRYALAGNAPLLVNRFNGQVVTTGTARPIGEYIAEYEASLASPAT
jgi:hypothetical protein